MYYINNNTFAFRQVTSQTWKYYGIFGFVPNERGSTRAQSSCQSVWEAFASPLERRVQNQHMVTISSTQLMGFAVLLLALIKQRCITASAPFWIGGELRVFVVRLHAPNQDARTVTVRYEYMYRATPSKHIYIIYIYVQGLKMWIKNKYWN